MAPYLLYSTLHLILCMCSVLCIVLHMYYMCSITCTTCIHVHSLHIMKCMKHKHTHTHTSLLTTKKLAISYSMPMLVRLRGWTPMESNCLGAFLHRIHIGWVSLELISWRPPVLQLPKSFPQTHGACQGGQNSASIPLFPPVVLK